MRSDSGSVRDRDGFRVFVARVSPALMRTAYVLTGDRGQAEDLLQAALRRVARSSAAIQGSPDAYAHRVLINLSGTRPGRSSLSEVCQTSLRADVRHDRRMKLRVTRHTDRLDEVVAFYRDGVGLREIGRFNDHDGYDGVFLDIPNTGAHLELTTGGQHRAPPPHPESLLVLYFDSQAGLDAVADRIARPEVVTANPYWRANARAYADPDGFQVLLALST